MPVLNVPGKTDAWLELLLGAVKGPIRWESRVTEILPIRSLRRWHHRTGENLPFPSQAIAQAQARKDLPFVQSEKGIIFVIDV